ncbi:hypothetical protein LTR37_020808 [Vermiconidia calcicola]|uniref:Uncharacterized protein n=1 Tax=Vermiconidia calcicola TaxID=1690605 RepID=A0ACC3MBL9_9PEZI|nr:hypothetical protein LTR37_020808 [Vermiconidia calcicola]
MADSDNQTKDASVAFGGSCACGRIIYTSTSLPTSSHACHCEICRELGGGPFVCYLDVVSKDVTFSDSKEHLHYEGLPKDDFGGISFLRFSKMADRAVCANCHSPLAMRYHHEEGIGLTLGTVDESTIRDDEVRKALKPMSHIFTSQKTWWFDPNDGLPMHERFTGDFEQAIKVSEGKEG